MKSFEELTATLAEFKANQHSARVLIRSDKRVISGLLIKVLGIASSVGLEKIQIGAQAPTIDD